MSMHRPAIIFRSTLYNRVLARKDAIPARVKLFFLAASQVYLHLGHASPNGRNLADTQQNRSTSGAKNFGARRK